jgi:hypothetical protein
MEILLSGKLMTEFEANGQETRELEFDSYNLSMTDKTTIST